MSHSALLKRILATKRAEVAAAKKAAPLQSLVEQLTKAPPTRGFRDAIVRRKAYELHLIGELKKASPVKGVIRAKFDVPALAKEVEAAGAVALSVLTDAKYFQGALANLMLAKQGCGLPVMRKDFIVDEYQLFESRMAGADAVLLIGRLLPGPKLKKFIQTARNLGLAQLVEVHSAAELRRAVDAGAELVGINTRDLDTFKTDFNLAAELRPRIPPGVEAVCESGVDSPRQIEQLRLLRFSAVLIGEALMRARHAAPFVHEMFNT